MICKSYRLSTFFHEFIIPAVAFGATQQRDCASHLYLSIYILYKRLKTRFTIYYVLLRQFPFVSVVPVPVKVFQHIKREIERLLRPEDFLLSFILTSTYLNRLYHNGTRYLISGGTLSQCPRTPFCYLSRNPTRRSQRR